MKTNYLKKCISVLLSISMIASLFAVSFTASAEEVLVVDGKSYQMGDIVELKGELQVNNWLMNGQVEVPYDNSKLKLVDNQTEEAMFPELTAQGITVFYNNLDEGKFLFNFSQPLTGADFTTSKTLYDLKFEVIGTGETALADGVKIVDMKSYNFEGSPEGKDDFTMVAVNDENGGIIADKGAIKNEAAPDAEEPVEKTLTVDGKIYNVGDTFTFVGDLQTNRWLMNTQFELNFDQTKLNVVEANYPVLDAAGITVFENFSNEEGWYTFNFSDPSKGANFTEKGELYVITFEVVGTGETTLNDKTNIVEMSSFPFDGDPADHKDEDLKPVDITDGNGALNPDNGTISNEIKDEAPVEETLTVDGKTYNVGETFKLVGQLQANRWVMNAQFVLNFDASKIKIVDTAYPAIEAAGIATVENYNNDEGWYKFNFTDVEKGVDFTSTANLYEVTFEVIAGGETTLADKANVEVLSTFQFEGSPADHPDEEIEIVDIADGNGGIKAEEGKIEHLVDPEEIPVEKTLTVDGKTYDVGDTFKLVGQLQSNRWVLNSQFDLEFDASKLKIVDTAYPAVTDAGITVYDNYDNDEGWYTFNFTDIENGVNFTKTANLYEVTFEVIAGGETTLADKAKFVALSTFQFEGSPADNPGEPIEIVDITDGNGGVNPDEGKVEHVIDPEEIPVTTLVVDGTEYNVGDTFRFNIDLETLRWILNAQYTMNFDASKLQIKSVEYPTVTEAGIGVIDNISNESGFFTFNFTDVTNGVDFTIRNVLATLEFEVVGTGETSLKNAGKFDVLSTFNFDGSPADPANEGKPIEITDITDGKGGVDPEDGKVVYYYGDPTVVEDFTVNGQEVQEGDIVEYRVWVKNDENWLVNGEFDILYTNAYLEFLDVTYPGLASIAGYVVDNQIPDSGLTESQGKPAGELLFNFSNIHSGVDFTEGAYMAIFRFKVHESTNPDIPAQGASVIELNGNVVNDMYAFKFAGSGASHSITEKQELDRLIGEDGLPTTDEFRLETEIIREIKIDVTELQKAYDKWSQFDTEGYTAESVANLNKALEEAKKILDDVAAGNADAYTQEIIDKMTADLNAAGEALVVDKQPLVDKIAEAQAYVDDEETLYVPETIEALKDAIEAAQAVVDDENATVQDVKDQIAALEEAINNLKKGAYLGDVDLSGEVTVVDATITQTVLAKFTVSVFYETLADVNKDGEITIYDVTLIQMIVAGLYETEIVAIPVE